MQKRIRLNSRLLPVLVLALLVLRLASPFAGWTVLLAGFGGAWLAGYLWARILSRSLRLTRQVRYGWAQVGDHLEERFILENNAFLPGLWVEVDDHTDMPGYLTSRATGIGALARVTWITQGQCTRRGMFTLGPTTLRTSDPLGLFTVEIHDPRRALLLVTPPMVPLPGIQVTAGGRSGEGRPRPEAPERTVSAAGTRPYTPGDSLRWIHWPTSARREQLFMRTFEGSPTSPWWILVDLDQACMAGEGQDSTEEHAVILAASLAARGLGLNRPVGLAANAQPLAWLPPREGEGQRWEILRSLAQLAPTDRSLPEMLVRLPPAFGRDSSLVLITANPDPAWVQHLLPLAWRGAVPTVLLLDPASFGGRGSAQGAAAHLHSAGIACTVIGRELLDTPQARPGQAGRWEWRVSPTGRAVAVRRPEDVEWRALS